MAKRPVIFTSDYYCISERVRVRNVSIGLMALCLVSIEIREF